MWVSKSEFEANQKAVESRLARLERGLEDAAREIAKLRSDFRTAAVLGGAILFVLNLASPILAVYFSAHR